MVHIPGLSRPFKSAPKATVRPSSSSSPPIPNSKPTEESTGSVPLQNPDLEGRGDSNASSPLESDFKAGNTEGEAKQEDGAGHPRLDDEGDDAGKPIVLEPEVEVKPGGIAQGGSGSGIISIPSEATSTSAPAAILATIPNPRTSGSSERSTTSSKSETGGGGRKGRTGGLTGSSRAALESDPGSSNVKDEGEEMNEERIKEEQTKKEEKGGQGREKERSIVVVGKRDRKRSTDTSSSSSSTKTGSGGGSGFTRDVLDDENKTPKPTRRFSSLFTSTYPFRTSHATPVSDSTSNLTSLPTSTSIPSSPPWSASDHFHTPPESPEPALVTAISYGHGDSSLQAQQQQQRGSGSGSIEGRMGLQMQSGAQGMEQLREDQGWLPTPRGPLPRRTSSLGHVEVAHRTGSKNSDLPAIPAEKSLPAIPPTTPPSKQRLPFPPLSPSNGINPRVGRAVSSPQHNQMAGPSTSQAQPHREREREARPPRPHHTHSHSSSISSATMSFPPMPNGIIITPSSPANDLLVSDRSPGRQRYHTVGRDSAARFSLGEVLDRADSRESQNQAQEAQARRVASGSAPAVVVSGAMTMGTTTAGIGGDDAGNDAEGDTSDEESGLKRSNTVRPSNLARAGRSRASEERIRSSDGSPEPRRRSIRRTKAEGLTVPLARPLSNNLDLAATDEEGMVPPPSTTSQITRYPSDSSRQSVSRGRLSPHPIDTHAAAKARSPSPATSARSITFSEKAMLAANGSGKQRSASGPLPDHVEKENKRKSKGAKKVSDGSLSDSGMPSGRFASLGMGFAAGKKRLQKARSFSDIRKRTEMETDDERQNPTSRVVAKAAEVDKEEEVEEMLSATPPRSGSMSGALLERQQAEPPTTSASAASAAEAAHKRKRSGSAGLLRSAAGFFGLRKDKKEDKVKEKDRAKTNPSANETSMPTSDVATGQTEGDLQPPHAAGLQAMDTVAGSPPRTAQPLSIPRPSTPSRAATLASSLTIRRRKRDHSTSRSLFTPTNSDGGKTPVGNASRMASLGYFATMGGQSSGSSAAVTPVDEFGGMSTPNWYDSPTSENMPARSLQTAPHGSFPETSQYPGSTQGRGLDVDSARRRAQSDTPHPPEARTPLSKQPTDRDFSKLFDGRGRPSLAARSNSANSDLAPKEKRALVAAPSLRRGRSGSLLKDAMASAAASSLMSPPATPSLMVSPTASTTSLVSSFGGKISRQGSYEAVNTGASDGPLDRFRTPSRRNTGLSSSFGDKGLPSVSEQPPRPSVSSSINSSVGSSSASKKVSLGPLDLLDVHSIHSSGSSGRKRSSTLFSNPPSLVHQAVPFSSPTRQRPTNPRRLSTGLFGSTWSRDSFFPSPQSGQELASAARRSKAPPALNIAAEKRDALHTIPAVSEEDDAETWLAKVRSASRRSDILFTLASSGDAIHIGALNIFMRDFDFESDALDVALRKLLMGVSLPKETQQIDRVMEAFAKRYDECHIGLLKDPDNAYVIAFSLMMLHTDVFNSNNKSKMSKAEYVKNTRLDGVPQIVLETFYDNVSFTPFIYVEDEELPKSATSSTTDGMSSQQSRKSRSDLYDWIRSNSLASLRIDVELVLPQNTPLSYIGTRPFFDPWQPKEAFATAPFIEVVKPRTRRKSGATLLVNATGPPQFGAVDREDPIVRLKVAKVGLLSRKDDLHEEGKKASNRKWKSWSVVLTGSQLIFIKEPTWALSLADHIGQLAAVGALTPGYLLSPRFNNFKPDEVFSLSSAVAIHDRSYDKHEFAFRLLMPYGRQYLLQAADEYEMNEWISLVNYASAFKTADIPMMAPLPVEPSISAPPSKRNSIVAETNNDTVRSTSSDVFGENRSIDPAYSDQLSPVASFDGRRPSSSLLTWPSGEVRDPGSRLEYLSRRVSGFRIKLNSLNQSLDEELRIARNLSVLTPFQRVTREAVETALLPTAANVRHLRTEICRISCWAEVLDAETRIAMPAMSSGAGPRTPKLTLTREDDVPVRLNENQKRSGSMASGMWSEDLSASLSALVPSATSTRTSREENSPEDQRS